MDRFCLFFKHEYKRSTKVFIYFYRLNKTKTMSLSTKYNPLEIEKKWYDYWMEHRLFRSLPDEREPFTILIPPPNVTGVLHMGHMLNNTIQDVLIRRARMQGKNACWVPGTDHASIATEAKVVALIKQEGSDKYKLGREKFLEKAFEWKDKYGGIILDQLKRLGASCDWDRTRFTMEPSLSEAVIKVFVDLYRKGKIYRGLRMTNWDPVALTALSNEEVIYKEENSQLFHLLYSYEENPSEGIVIATQRPETIMADVAIAVHPDDDRYKGLIGKKVLIPLINKPIPIITDTYVDREFGTGALKITPAHDINDHEVGQRHRLEVINILNEDGTLNEKAQILVGEDRFIARKKIRKLLEEAGSLVKLEDYRTKVGHSERTDAIVEPRLTMQWFLEMKDFAKIALDAVSSGEVSFFPEHMFNMYNSWLREENVRDWCISRQLWWGHRIPAWYFTDSSGVTSFVVAETEDEALHLARQRTGIESLEPADLRQDEDVLDTWFSSWLWPLSVFDAFKDPSEATYYYPTQVLVTGWDIMFFWVARMIMAGYEWAPEILSLDIIQNKGKQPFKDVYFTGMVRDSKRRKMSKSLGNSPDALTLIDTYGADGVRFGMLSCSTAGNDIIFDAPIDPKTGQVINESKLCEQGRNFCNKMWNVYRGISGWQVRGTAIPSEATIQSLDWFDNRLKEATIIIEQNYQTYRLADALMELYKLVWDDFCSWHFEVLKPAKETAIDQDSYYRLLGQFDYLLRLLHPFMPFITEELWQAIQVRSTGESLCCTAYPEVNETFDSHILSQMQKARELVTQVRNLRNQKGISPKEAIVLYVNSNDKFFYEDMRSVLKKMANLEEISFVIEKPDGSAVFMLGADECSVIIQGTVDAEAEKEKLEQELAYYEGFLKSVQGKLKNDKFVNHAPAQVVAMERKKEADAEAKIAAIKASLKSMK
jgi:valyl-tRNA synthetase